MLYGASLVGGNIFTASKLAERKDELLKAWSVHRSALNSSYRNSYHNGYITALRDGFYKGHGQHDRTRNRISCSKSQCYDEIAKLLEIELRAISLDDRNDHYRTVTRLVARARFFYTDVYKFLVDRGSTHQRWYNFWKKLCMWQRLNTWLTMCLARS